MYWRFSDDVESANTATTGNVQCANVLSEVVGGNVLGHDTSPDPAPCIINRGDLTHLHQCSAAQKQSSAQHI